MPSRPRLLATTFVALLLAVAVPEVLLWRTAARLDSAACGGAAGEEPPSVAFYRAVDRLDTLSLVPWTSGRAADAATRGAMGCLRVYTDACGAIRDDAVAAARRVVDARLRGEGSGAAVAEQAANWHAHLDTAEVDAFCGAWAQWRRWLAHEGLDAAAACPVCE